MTLEQNKQIMYDYFDCINNKNWAKFANLIHDDFGEKWSGANFKLGSDIGNPFMEFIRLVRLPENKISEWWELMNRNDKQGHIEERKFASGYLINWEIKDIMAEGDRVWALRECVFNDPYQRHISLTSFFFLIIKENQIINFAAVGRYYNSLIQYGNIIIDRNDEEEVENYIQMLKNIGIIPKHGYK
jgi:hypothetical protein